jgi:alkylhydroperoxidase family enzyme
LSEDVASLLDLATPPGQHPPPTIALLALQPPLLAPFLGWAAALALNGVLPKRDHELLALRSAWHCRSAFEWGEHVEFARAAGLDDDEITNIVSGPAAGRWTEREAALLRAADELHASCTIGDATWEVLAAHYEPGALVEIPYVVGQYTMLSMVGNAFGFGAQPGQQPMPP